MIAASVVADNLGPYLVFDVGSPADGATGTFALQVTDVLQVIEPDQISKVPLSPDVVLGILNYHGRIITVVDPAPILGLAAQGDPVSQIVLVKLGRRHAATLGLQVLRSHGIVPKRELKRVDVPLGPCVGWVAQAQRRLIHIVDVEPLREKLGREFGSTDNSEPG